jgi:anti-anti-sigma factor
LLVQVAGELDVVTSPHFLSCLNLHPALTDVGEVEFDLTKLTFLDVVGVRAVLEMRDRVTGAGCQLAVRGLDPNRLPLAGALSLDRRMAEEPPGRGAGETEQ